MINRLFDRGPEVVHLESGLDIEAQIRKINPRKRKGLLKRMNRRGVLIIGAVLGSVACCGGASVALTIIKPLVAP